MIRLIVGLGNPGAEYATTRHNAGFWLVDAIAQQKSTSLRHEARFHGAVARVHLYGNEVWLLEPSTFMNRSGLAVGALSRFYKIAANEVLVVHDELDLSPGTAKLKLGGGSGGHNGLKDIDAHLSTQKYWRLRLGIGHPRNMLPAGSQAKADVSHFVLKPPPKEEQTLIDIAIERSLDVLPLIIDEEMERAMRQLHRSDSV